MYFFFNKIIELYEIKLYVYKTRLLICVLFTKFTILNVILKLDVNVFFS